VNSVLLFTVPSIILYPQADISTTTTHTQEIAQESLQTASLLSYDDVLNLIDDLEDGELEKRCNQADLEKINYFLVNLATQGVLPNEIEEEFVLQNDIQELLNGEENLCEYSFSLSQGNDYVIASAALYDQGEIVLCKSWIKKKWAQTKKFVKKHKKAILIGAVVVITAMVVVGVVAASSAAAATAGAAAAGSDKSKEKDEQRSGESSSTSLPDTLSVSETPILRSVIEEHVSAFKETVAEENSLQTSSYSKGHEDAALGEKFRNLGAILAHETLDGISEITSYVPQLLEEIKSVGHRVLPESLLHSGDEIEITPMKNFDNLVAAGHEKIDQVFSTDQAAYHTSEAKEGRDKFTVRMLPPPGMFTKISINTNKLAEAGKALDRAGLTKAGRGLMKHGYREGSSFPKPTGNFAQVNEQGQKVLESLLNHPEKVVYERPHLDFGKVIDVVVPGKGGARFTVDGEMIGFLEP
jgi:hypothetical protein